MLSATSLANPLPVLIAIVDVWEDPATIVRDGGEADSVKSGPVIVTTTEVSWKRKPLEAKMSTV